MVRMPVCVVLVVACLGGVGALGQTNLPYLVKDINPNGTSFPIGLEAFDGRLYFNAADGVNGQELWVSDGTEAGTFLFKEIVPGSDGGVPQGLIRVGGALFFQADNNIDGLDLWVTDGTLGGTVNLADVNPGSESPPPGQCVFMTNMEAAGGAVYYQADDVIHGRELWRSDGTAEGTAMVIDLNPGPDDSNPGQLTDIGGMLFFVGRDGPTSPTALWRTDGTEAGTIQLTTPHHTAINLVDVNGIVFFRSDDFILGKGSVFGAELWKSDGTPEGTVMVKDIHPTGDATPGPLANINGILFLTAFEPVNGRELWKSDGTEQGTVLVKDMNPGPGGGKPNHMINVNGTAFFQASDGVSGRELWRSDGTEAGTYMIRDIFPGPDWSEPEDLIDVNGTLYFTADDGVHGREIWKSDGTAEGTSLAADINPGPIGGFGWELTNVEGVLFFKGFDGGDTSAELWALDTRPPIEKDIPAASAAGMVVMALIILGIGGVLIGRRRSGVT